MCVQYILWKGESWCFIDRCNVQYQRGVHEVVIIQMPEKSRCWFLCFSFCLSNLTFPSWNLYLSVLSYSQYHTGSATLPVRHDSLLHLDLSVVWQVAAGISTDWHCKEMCACTFVWYLNQTAAGSRPAVCYQNTQMDVWGNEGKAVGIVFANILLFLWLRSYYCIIAPIQEIDWWSVMPAAWTCVFLWARCHVNSVTYIWRILCIGNAEFS